MSRALQFELRLAERMSRLGTETAFEVLNRARALERQGKDIIHLEIGEPDFDTPQNVIEAGVEAMRGGWTHYGPSAGYPDLRQAIADEVSRSRMHAAGKSEDGPGYALRFPRIVKERPERTPEDATTVEEVVELHNMQGKGDTRGKRKSEE